MSSLIEQAAQRLEQLRQAGVAAPDVPTTPIGPSSTAAPDSPPIAASFSTAPADVAEQSSPLLAESAGSASAEGPTASLVRSPRIEFDFALLAAANIVTPNAPRSQVADEFRILKRPLISNAKSTGAAAPARANLIMVTSAVAGEGKSFTSINLAMSIAAELDCTVMLVDADLARPSLPRMLGVPDGPGLLDLLEGSAEMSSVLLRTNIDKLTFMRSGTPHARATELLASDAMRRLLDDMSKRYSDRIIIFDSPPLLLTTESRALAMYMGQIVFVVRADKTLQSAVQHALSTIEACPLKLMLLNQTRSKTSGAYGDYGLGYGYGYGYGYAPKKRGA
jgi:protein-tyrosine kinase